jgi:hypothetical protein
MSDQPPPEPFLDLAVALRRAAAELDVAAARRRVETERLRNRWLGGRRRAFDVQSAELDALTTRALADLRSLARVADTVAEGGR